MQTALGGAEAGEGTGERGAAKVNDLPRVPDKLAWDGGGEKGRAGGKNKFFTVSVVCFIICLVGFLR